MWAICSKPLCARHSSDCPISANSIFPIKRNMANIPIWKEERINLDKSDSRTFEIWLNRGGKSTLIYSGIAYPDPENGEIFITPNEIVATYLAQEWTFGSVASLGIDKLVAVPTLTADITLKVQGDDDRNMTFSYDWSYIGASTPRVALAPIDTRVTEQMYFPITDYESTGSARFYGLNASGSVQGSFSLKGDTGAVNGLLGINKFVVYTAMRAFYLDIAGATQHRYQIVDGCNPYALFYVNAFGCWEVLRLVSGTEAHGYDRATFNKKHNPTNITESRGKTNYQNVITRQWQVGTDWLTDAGAQNISHLIGSTNVWLHDINNGEIVPVIITDTASENKTFRNQGRQLVRYDINLQLAQDRLRR